MQAGHYWQKGDLNYFNVFMCNYSEFVLFSPDSGSALLEV